MRISYFLLAGAAAFLASCEAVSAATVSAHAKLLALASRDAVQSLDAVSAGKRFLRSTNTQRYGDDDDDDDLDNLDLDSDDDDVYEERGWGFKGLADDALRKLIDDFPGANERISHWRYNDFSPAQVKKELRVTNMKDMDDPNVELYKLFLAANLRSNFKVN
ncbi:hypothetical protein PHYBOEH_005861 [Phytophthora boehmeriae]|uniref:RxLR effector protein n=1 Tax=Phytophthora boehmeriae TaxID=109152 RepID=A0A8T1WNY8_9STRA|nr:hypothetical protein PHYBOEH_005861 [Phytophthora boehmeriae]